MFVGTVYSLFLELTNGIGCMTYLYATRFSLLESQWNSETYSAKKTLPADYILKCCATYTVNFDSWCLSRYQRALKLNSLLFENIWIFMDHWMCCSWLINSYTKQKSCSRSVIIVVLNSNLCMVQTLSQVLFWIKNDLL